MSINARLLPPVSSVSLLWAAREQRLRRHQVRDLDFHSTLDFRRSMWKRAMWWVRFRIPAIVFGSGAVCGFSGFNGAAMTEHGLGLYSDVEEQLVFLMTAFIIHDGLPKSVAGGARYSVKVKATRGLTIFEVL